MASNLGYTCPKCGNTDYFIAEVIEVTLHQVPFGPDGYSYMDYEYSESEIREDCNIECAECGFISYGRDFMGD